MSASPVQPQVMVLMLVPAAAMAVIAFTVSYWPVLAELVNRWSEQPDYSHGFMVPPLAAMLLWLRRDSFPGLARRIDWWGMSLIGLSGLMRIVAAWGYFESIGGWSIPVWVAGVTWLFCGRSVLLWAAPAVVFLGFMVPLPFRIEGMLSRPLQRIATQASCFALQSMGLPALAEGNTILLGSSHFEVEEACSGLRIFMATIALAFACVVIVRRSWWERALLLASAIPIALLANSLRIVATGSLSQVLSSETARWFAHDLSGWAMIPVAAGMFGLVWLYLRYLIRDLEQADARLLVRARQAAPGRK
ncbi:MAG: exosortase/archaeosortase family protein [Planctomycetes bacterium]|nr:exosortase/archaeosortase family protein [Planctomycetota bacterium]